MRGYQPQMNRMNTDKNIWRRGYQPQMNGMNTDRNINLIKNLWSYVPTGDLQAYGRGGAECLKRDDWLGERVSTTDE